MGVRALVIVTPKEFGKDHVKAAYEHVLTEYRDRGAELGYSGASAQGRHYFALVTQRPKVKLFLGTPIVTGLDNSDTVDLARRISKSLAGKLWYVEVISAAGDSAYQFENGVMARGFTTVDAASHPDQGMVQVKDEPWSEFAELSEDGILDEIWDLDNEFFSDENYEVLVTPKPKPWWKFW